MPRRKSDPTQVWLTEQYYARTDPSGTAGPEGAAPDQFEGDWDQQDYWDDRVRADRGVCIRGDDHV